MAVIVADEVGIFRCKFEGIRNCKNPEYCNLILSFEMDINGEVKDWDSFPKPKYILQETKDLHKFQHLTAGKVYLIKMAVGYQSPNNKDGKSYPGGVRFKPIQVLKEA